MAGLSFGVLRIGKKYFLLNHGERHEFVIEYITTQNDFGVKDLHTLERYLLTDLYQFGKGHDFEIRELG